jgi:uncharacterized membrane protein
MNNNNFSRRRADRLATSYSTGHNARDGGHIDGYDSDSHSGGGYSTGGYSSGGGSECCPLVIDPLTLTAILGFIAAATFLLQQLIVMTIMGRKRKKRNLASATATATDVDFFLEGKLSATEKIRLFSRPGRQRVQPKYSFLTVVFLCGCIL